MTDDLGTFKTKHGTVTLTAATDEEVVEALCGPWEGRWNRLVPHQDVFGPACAIHDDDYTTPVGMTRREADARFLDNLTERAGRCPYLRAMGFTFWLAVRLGGWVYFDRRYDRAKAWLTGLFA